MALVVLSVWTSAVHVDYVLKSERLEQSDSHTLVSQFILRIATVFITAFGIVLYVSVSSRKPRPRQLHVYGLILVIGLLFQVLVIWSEIVDRLGHHLTSWIGTIAAYVVWGGYRTMFYKVMMNKLTVLGLQASRCRDARLWGNSMLTSIVVSAIFGTASWSFAVNLLLRGVPADEVLGAGQRSPAEQSKVTVAEWTVYAICINGAAVGICGYFVTAAAFLCAVRSLMRREIAALVARGIAENLLAKVRSTLKQHFLGLMLSLSTTMAFALVSLLDATNALADEVAEDVASAVVSLIDCGGDVAGILLLSGIGKLLWGEDPSAGDVNKQIWDLLHAAVLTGRGDLTFEGEVAVTPSRLCIASFPGKYLQEWKALTWLCERHELSSACVFLPRSDPQERYGQHSLCSETPGQCWCAQLYGERKEWGCRWFEDWRANIERAVALELDLVVVFFPGQVGQGLVEWKDLATRGEDLWIGDGLGGSQKGEAAFLLKHDIKFMCQDLTTVQSWLTSGQRIGGPRPLARSSS